MSSPSSETPLLTPGKVAALMVIALMAGVTLAWGIRPPVKNVFPQATIVQPMKVSIGLCSGSHRLRQCVQGVVSAKLAFMKRYQRNRFDIDPHGDADYVTYRAYGATRHHLLFCQAAAWLHHKRYLVVSSLDQCWDTKVSGQTVKPGFTHPSLVA